MKGSDPLRFSVKLFLREPIALDAEVIVKIFHRWIQGNLLESDLLLDVADYTHVHEGPGIMLICDGTYYSLDEGDGRIGLVYSVKRDRPEGIELGLQIRNALLAVLHAACQLESEPELLGRLRFSCDELLFKFINGPVRLTEEQTFQLQTTTKRTVDSLFSGATKGVRRLLHNSRLLTLDFRLEGAPPLTVIDSDVVENSTIQEKVSC